MSVVRYDSGVTYDSGARYGPEGAQKRNTMAKIKLELKLKSDVELRDMGTTHKSAMASPPGSGQFLTPTPAAGIFDPALAAYAATLAQIDLEEAHLASLRSLRDQQRLDLEGLINQRAAYVQSISGGDPAMIQNSGFSIQSEAVPTSAIDNPENLVAVSGVQIGEVKLTCRAVPRAKSYIWECRTHDDAAVPGSWAQVKVSGKAKLTAPGLTPGKKYAFRVRALGPNEVESGWSDEAVVMVT
jgi:hypothetical protein